MGLLNRFFADSTVATEPRVFSPLAPRARRDEGDIVRQYRALLRTAPPEIIEQVHAEAFGKLTDDQRAVVYEGLSRGAGTGERPLSSESATLARAASRAESRRAGSISAAFSVSDPLLGIVAAHVVRSPLASAFLPWNGAPASGRH